VSVTFPNAGSQNELLSEVGASLANKNMSFKSGSGLSSLVILRNLENDGAVPWSFFGRYESGLGFTCAPDKAERLIPLIATKCSYEKWDVRDAINLSNDIIDEAMSNTQIVLTDHLYGAAYGPQSSLGRSCHTKNVNPEALIAFRERCYVTNGAVVVATGVKDHDMIVNAVQDGFSHLNAGSKEKASASYLGGESRVSAKTDGYAHVAIAFESLTNKPLGNILKHCLSQTSNASSFNAPGLVGVYVSSPALEAGNAVDNVCSTLLQPLTDEVVSRAKTLAKAEALMVLDNGSKDLAQALTNSVIEKGSFSYESESAAYDDISNEMVINAFAKMISTKPSLAAVGEIDAVPYHATIAVNFS
jgi:predicted Zn-dependent peptidase